MSGAQSNTAKCATTMLREIVGALIQGPFQSGLTQACLTSTHSHEEVSKAVLDYIKKWLPQRRIGILAGNSVHADRTFLVKYMPEVMEWLHYRFIFPIAQHAPILMKIYLVSLVCPYSHPQSVGANGTHNFRRFFCQSKSCPSRFNHPDLAKELCRRWYPQLGIPRLAESNHRSVNLPLVVHTSSPVLKRYFQGTG
jgi:oligoribonuclease (3'-5' exoribonuclease)